MKEGYNSDKERERIRGKEQEIDGKKVNERERTRRRR